MLELLFELICDGVMAGDVVTVRIYGRRVRKYEKVVVVLRMFRSFELLGHGFEVVVLEFGKVLEMWGRRRGVNDSTADAWAHVCLGRH